MQTYARLLMIGGLVGSLACAQNPEDEEVSPRQDTTMVEQDTIYDDGMEADTMAFPPYDTTGQQDTLDQGYEPPDMEEDTLYQQPGMEEDTLYQQPGMEQDTMYQQPGQDTLSDTLDQGYEPYPGEEGVTDTMQQDTAWQADTSAWETDTSAWETDTSTWETDTSSWGTPDTSDTESGWGDPQ